MIVIVIPARVSDAMIVYIIVSVLALRGSISDRYEGIHFQSKYASTKRNNCIINIFY